MLGACMHMGAPWEVRPGLEDQNQGCGHLPPNTGREQGEPGSLGRAWGPSASAEAAPLLLAGIYPDVPRASEKLRPQPLAGEVSPVLLSSALGFLFLCLQGGPKWYSWAPTCPMAPLPWASVGWSESRGGGAGGQVRGTGSVREAGCVNGPVSSGCWGTVQPDSLAGRRGFGGPWVYFSPT